MPRDSTANTAAVQRIMLAFAERTGLAGDKNPPRRYLWTDAFAVTSFLGLYRLTDDEKFRQLALALVDQVHSVLGRHRPDDPRSGWISGLDEEAGQAHPTVGGLRIGKKLNERSPNEPPDERLEWDRDGQYFHYLTKWMHALCRVGAVTGLPQYGRWAFELAKAAHARFRTATPDGAAAGLYWKMSIDLSRPLLPSTGLHDSLDAFVTYSELSLACGDGIEAGLAAEIAEAAAMIAGKRWHTDDPLGLGGLLFDSSRLLQLSAAGSSELVDLAASLVKTALESLDAYAGHTRLGDPPEYRLAFRELGLSIGLKAVPMLRTVSARSPAIFDDELKRNVERLARFEPLAGIIETFWLDAHHQRATTWVDHRDINEVMLASSLLPDEFLRVLEPGSARSRGPTRSN